jgi:hypothetical protein
MKQLLMPLLILTTSAVLLSGCTFEDLFAKIATTPEEQGAHEAIVRSEKLAAKQQVIDQKISEHDTSIRLNNVNETETFDVYVFKSIEDKTTIIEVEALLPNPGKQLYEIWLRDAQNQAISLGPLLFNQDEDFSLTYATDDDLSSYSTVILSRESVADEVLETVIMTGVFQLE